MFVFSTSRGMSLGRYNSILLVILIKYFLTTWKFHSTYNQKFPALQIAPWQNFLFLFYYKNSYRHMSEALMQMQGKMLTRELIRTDIEIQFFSTLANFPAIISINSK